MSVNVICMKWGAMYGPEYVNNLKNGVARNLDRDHRFVCFTDDSTGIDSDVEIFPLPDLYQAAPRSDRRWTKLGLFQKELGDLSGTSLFLDLDVVVVDSLDCFFESSNSFSVIRDDDLFRSKPLRALNPRRQRWLNKVGNSSVFRFEIGAHAYILESYLANPAEAMSQYEISQQFMSAQLAKRGHLNYWPSDWCVSFKNTCVPRYLKSYLFDPEVPASAKIIVFAGNPKMSEVLDGGGQKWYRHIGNVDWLRKVWST